MSIGFDMSVRKWTNQRLMDLVRYQRHALHDAGLITEGEFAFLVNEGSSAARRLEDYDAMRAEVERLRGLLAEAYKELRFANSWMEEMRAIPHPSIWGDSPAVRRAMEGK